jgi:hypothetical protein
VGGGCGGASADVCDAGALGTGPRTRRLAWPCTRTSSVLVPPGYLNIYLSIYLTNRAPLIFIHHLYVFLHA